MQTRRTLLWTGLALVLLLSGCGRAEQEEPTGVPGAATSPISTPIVVFGDSPAPSPTPALPPSLYFQPSVINLVVGETATINIWADGMQRLHSIQLELSFNPDYVQVEDANAEIAGVQITPGDISQPIEITRDEVTVGEDGRIFYEANQEPGTGIDGSSIVASIMLRGVAAGGTPLRFESVAAHDPEGNVINIMPLSDGMITVVSGDATPTTAPVEATVQPTAPSTEGTTPAATTVPTAAPAPVVGGGIYYVVQLRENLYRIGLKFGTTAEAIAAASSITDPNQVQAGAMVLVPVAPPQGGYGYYVQPRDTVYSIARRFGMTAEGLAALNSIGPDYHIEVGQILVVTP